MTFRTRLAAAAVILLFCFSNSLLGDVLFNGSPSGVPFSSDDTTGGVIISYGFTISGSEMIVSDLGLWDEFQDGFGSNYEVGLYNAAGNLLASVIMPAGTTSELFGEFRYEPIEPIVLETGVEYVLVAFYPEFTNDTYLRDSLSNVNSSGNLADGITVTGGDVCPIENSLDFLAPDGDNVRIGPNLRCPQVAILGDVNCDGSVDLLDVSPFIDLITSGEFESKADINQDGAVNLLDVSPFIDLLTSG